MDLMDFQPSTGVMGVLFSLLTEGFHDRYQSVMLACHPGDSSVQKTGLSEKAALTISILGLNKRWSAVSFEESYDFQVQGAMIRQLHQCVKGNLLFS